MNGNDDGAVEVEATRVQASQALTTAPAASGAALATLTGAAAALANMTDEEFEAKVRTTQIVRDRVRRIKESLLVPGVHFGMPGAKTREQIEKATKDGKVGLYKAGAEAVAEFFGLVAGDPDIRIDRGDPENGTSPTFEMHARVAIHRGDTSGPVIAVGIGAWSTWELKNRYRTQKRKCPSCGNETLVMQKEARGGQYKGKPVAWCSPRDGGCNGEWLQADPAIAGQPSGKVANRDAADLLNTGVKMVKKRAFVDGIISAAALSDVFTQDVEDLTPEQKAARDAEIEAGAKATTDAMYGAPGGDPERWREEVEGNGAPPETSSSAPPAPPDTPAPAASGAKDPEWATDAQVRALKALLRVKHGAVTRQEQEIALHERCGVPDTVELVQLTKQDASRLITQLNTLPDLVAK